MSGRTGWPSMPARDKAPDSRSRNLGRRTRARTTRCGTATNPDAPPARALDARFDATYRGVIEVATDMDYYRVRAPRTSGAANLNVMVWATDGAPEPARAGVRRLRERVAFRVLANDGGLMSVVVQNARGASYYIQVSGTGPGPTGAYILGADFNQVASRRRRGGQRATQPRRRRRPTRSPRRAGCTSSSSPPNAWRTGPAV